MFATFCGAGGRGAAGTGVTAVEAGTGRCAGLEAGGAAVAGRFVAAGWEPPAKF
ncbi:MAG: hypothetical protein LBG74_08320 [Spirochaetaceae bacterium]|nr:hypothetical protein [Spirochaetaceae bacterium]